MKAATLSPHSAALPGAISIHAAREGGDVPCYGNYNKQAISIHAAREGGDAMLAKCIAVNHISIHAAREGGDGLDTRFLVD